MTADLPGQVYEFRGAYGRFCTLAAAALHTGSSNEAVRLAMAGEGESVQLRNVRAQRGICNQLLTRAAARLRVEGKSQSETTEILVAQAGIAKRAVQSEWGRDRDNTPSAIWDSIALPIVNVV